MEQHSWLHFLEHSSKNLNLDKFGCTAFCGDLAHHYQTLTIDATFHVALRCNYRISKKTFREKNV